MSKGEMVRYMEEEQVTDLEKLKDFLIPKCAAPCSECYVSNKHEKPYVGSLSTGRHTNDRKTEELS